MTDASVHDSQKLDGLLNKTNTSNDVYADSAYRSAEIEARLAARGLRSRIHVRRGETTAIGGEGGGQPHEEQGTRPHRACIRRAGEHSGRGLRAYDRHRPGKAKIGLANLVYNIRRLITLERIAAA